MYNIRKIYSQGDNNGKILWNLSLIHISLDEKVIVYGGVDKVAGKAQSFGGAGSYNVTEGDGASPTYFSTASQ